MRKRFLNQGTCIIRKKLHGDRMMKSIMPDVLEGKCKHFFKPVYHELADFDVEKEE